MLCPCSSSSHKACWVLVTWNWPNNFNKRSINSSKLSNLCKQGRLRPRGEEPHLDAQLESGDRGRSLSQTVFCSNSAPYSLDAPLLSEADWFACRIPPTTHTATPEAYGVIDVHCWGSEQAASKVRFGTILALLCRCLLFFPDRALWGWLGGLWFPAPFPGIFT